MNLGQVYTRRNIADFMTDMLDLEGGSQVLDPCFGHGVFVESLLEHTDYFVTGVEIDEDSYNSFHNPNPFRCKLKNCDFFDLDSFYDGIIMNPPYVRQEEIDQLAPLGLTKIKVQSACGLVSMSTKANLYMYFIIKAILMLRDGGQLVAIFPNSWTNTPVGREFYGNMLRFGCIQRFINVEGEAFEGSPLVDVCIMKFVRGGNGETQWEKLTINGNCLSLAGVVKTERKTANGLIRLKSKAVIRRGITTGYNKLFVNPPLLTRKHLVDILSSPKNVMGYSTRNSRLDKLLAISSNDILSDDEQTYIDSCAKMIEMKGKPLTLYDQIKKSQKWYITTLPPKAQIIFAYIVRKTMKFVLNDGNYNVRDNFYSISSSYNSFLLMSLLNNFHVFCQLEKCGKSYGKGVLKLQKYDIDGIMIPNPMELREQDIAELIKTGEELSRTGNESLIDKTTAILDKYYDTDKSKDDFFNLKQKRLAQTV